MNWIVFHIGSGQAFFSGALLIILATVISSRNSTKAGNWFARFGLLVGTVLIVISATPLPYYCFVIAFLATIIWAIASQAEKLPKWGSFCLIVVWIGMMAVEIPFHFSTTPTPVSARSIAIIGDSITAGYGGSDHTTKWPELLAKNHNLQVENFSQPGATVTSSLKRLKEEKVKGGEPVNAPIVILEIGGNDLLGNTSSLDYEQALEELIELLIAPDRQLIMVELPLPPFSNQFGIIQRKLAEKHKVKLIPKRLFLGVLAAKGSTVDSLHLTQDGHERMAAMVWEAIGPAFDGDRE